MGCYKVIAMRRDYMMATAKRPYGIRFYASLICSIVNDVVKYYFVSKDNKQFCDKDGRFFAGKEYFNN